MEFKMASSSPRDPHPTSDALAALSLFEEAVARRRDAEGRAEIERMKQLELVRKSLDAKLKEAALSDDGRDASMEKAYKEESSESEKEFRVQLAEADAASETLCRKAEDERARKRAPLESEQARLRAEADCQRRESLDQIRNKALLADRSFQKEHKAMTAGHAADHDAHGLRADEQFACSRVESTPDLPLGELTPKSSKPRRGQHTEESYRQVLVQAEEEVRLLRQRLDATLARAKGALGRAGLPRPANWDAVEIKSRMILASTNPAHMLKREMEALDSSAERLTSLCGSYRQARERRAATRRRWTLWIIASLAGAALFLALLLEST